MTTGLGLQFMEGTTAGKIKLGRKKCHRNLQVKYPSAFQAGNTTMVLEKSPADFFFCFYTYLAENSLTPLSYRTCRKA